MIDEIMLAASADLMEKAAVKIDELAAERDELKERVRVLEDALREYGECKSECTASGLRTTFCDCGFQQALTGGKERD